MEEALVGGIFCATPSPPGGPIGGPAAASLPRASRLERQAVRGLLEAFESMPIEEGCHALVAVQLKPEPCGREVLGDVVLTRAKKGMDRQCSGGGRGRRRQRRAESTGCGERMRSRGGRSRGGGAETSTTITTTAAAAATATHAGG